MIVHSSPAASAQYAFYKANEADSDEAVIKKWDETGSEELYSVCCLGEFEGVDEILRFFGITSAESITCVDVYTLQYQKGDDYGRYEHCGRFDNIGEETYNLLATTKKSFIVKPGGSIYGDPGPDSADYETWAAGSRKTIPKKCRPSKDGLHFLVRVTGFAFLRKSHAGCELPPAVRQEPAFESAYV